jgi:hypothetical protein
MECAKRLTSLIDQAFIDAHQRLAATREVALRYSRMSLPDQRVPGKIGRRAPQAPAKRR